MLEVAVEALRRIGCSNSITGQIASEALEAINAEQAIKGETK